jgi:hypothetical protein
MFFIADKTFTQLQITQSNPPKTAIDSGCRGIVIRLVHIDNSRPTPLSPGL